MQINPIQPISPSSISSLTGVAGKTGTSPASGAQSAGQSFTQMLDSLNQSQTQSDSMVQQLAQGGNVDLHDVMIATEENDVNFRVAMAIRDKLVDAYRQVMQMNV
jgi:flagellar hook-basal body complex protein FliE